MKKLTKENFIEKARKVHGDKYNYDEFVFNGSKVKSTIICPIHGRFEQSMEVHCGGHGCRECGKEEVRRKNSYTLEEFKEKVHKIHGDKYDLSKVVYKNNKCKVSVICHEKDKNGVEHGEFKIRAEHLCNGVGCSKCSGNSKRTIESFIMDANKVHDNKYDYSKSKYVNVNTLISIICPTHGEFKQKVNDHLRGIGCQMCKCSTLERKLYKLLRDNKIEFIPQCSKSTLNWLGQQSLDFYIPQYNIAIECQGIQHYKPIDFFGGQKSLDDTIKRDERKRKLCEENGIKLLYFADKQYKNDIITDENKLIEEIKKYDL